MRPLPPILSQQVGEAGGSLIRVVTERVASGPDKVGACQHCQMVRVRRAGWKGVREEPVFTSLKAGSARIWRIWAESGASQPISGWELLGRLQRPAGRSR